MQRHHANWLACLCLAANCSFAAADAGSHVDLIAALKADGPHASLSDEAKTFGRLVGSWDVEYLDILKDGRQLHRTGQLIVGWVLDGRAIQDVWIVDPSEGRVEREVYSDLRYFDAKSHTWPAVFFDPEHASIARFTAAAASKDRIVLETSDLGHPQNRWSFIDIGPDGFGFRDEASDDGGKTWKRLSEYHMKRHGAKGR